MPSIQSSSFPPALLRRAQSIIEQLAEPSDLVRIDAAIRDQLGKQRLGRPGEDFVELTDEHTLACLLLCNRGEVPVHSTLGDWAQIALLLERPQHREHRVIRQ